MKVKEVYCPYCRSKKPMTKSGIIRWLDKERQRYQCVNKNCNRTTVNPLRSK